MPIWDFIHTYGGQILGGTLVTCAQFLLASAVAVTVAMVAGLGKLSRNLAVRGAATVYIEIFRGTSLLVQLYWIFFVLPLFGITLEKFWAGFLSVGLNVGAYGAENQKASLFQTYVRDTGEILADLTMPIMLNGRHWGAVRIGYRSVS